ncbi:MmpS family transport accessory protein [Streptomyces melanogenes]|uniref:MmpS family transport accessory protein n=1 Tax=Streptomyces melanogenes TaxID=67326 RepID=A0ABZ1XDB7_9ACTN|nr:MmpS family transport accessory protein [Streptomyces melanogenes]
MKRTFRAVCTLAAAGLAIGLTACSKTADKAADKAAEQVDKVVTETYEVTYEVTGKGVDSIDFHGGGGEAMKPKVETVQKPALPWKKTVTLRGIMPPAVMPVAADTSGSEVTCKIIYKDKVLKEEKGQGLVTAGGCVAVSPVGSN